MTKYDILEKLMGDYNEYSELVALNYAQVREGRIDDGTLEWNRGHLYCIEGYLIALARDLDVNLTWEFGPHSFGFDDWKRTLEYRTVHY